MGGAAAGEAASQYFIDMVRSAFSELALPPKDAVPDRIQHVFESAKGRMLEHIIQHPADAGMGCTADLLVFDDGRYVIGHVGDSRVYLLRHGRLRQLTKDHSLVQSQLDRGMLTPEEAKHHPRKNILLRVLGTDTSMACDIMQGAVFGNDIFLLCSDGLTDMVENADIEIMLASAESLEQKVERLISTALEAGGKDNVTVILCEVEDV
jgi:protein phosphatase